MNKKGQKFFKPIHATQWLIHHGDSFKSSIKRILSQPLSFVFTILMIAIAFAIPMSSYILFKSVEQLTMQWDNDKQITLFLKEEVTFAQTKQLATRIADYENIEHAIAVNKDQALEEFKQQTALGSIVDGLSENPLPHLIIAYPHSSASTLSILKNLETKLRSYKQVQHIQFDLLWFQRLQAMLVMVNRIQWIVSLVLLIAIGLIIANVIRWEVTSRHAEIEIIKLVGATDAYVRRPFLYSGLCLGLLGSLVALTMVMICRWLVQQSALELSTLFGSDFQLSAISLRMTFSILFGASFLGIGSAWFAVTHKLKSFS